MKRRAPGSTTGDRSYPSLRLWSGSQRESIQTVEKHYFVTLLLQFFSKFIHRSNKLTLRVTILIAEKLTVVVFY